jgi:drug/metabolite transporter (DMT)-like permease
LATGPGTADGRQAPRALLGAALWMSGALASFMAMAIAGRELSAELSVLQIMAFRAGVCAAVLVAIMAATGWTPLRTARLGLHLGRNTIHFSATFGWFYGITVLPLAEVFAIEFTAPVWTALLAALFLGERLTAARLGAALLGFAGVLVILRPGLAVVQPASFAVLWAAIGYAATYVFTRHMAPTEKPMTILIYMNLVQLPLALAPALPGWVWPSLALWPWIAVVGLVGLTSHYCVARAFALADAALVAPMDFLRLPLVALVGWLAYEEAIDLWVAVGAAVILAGNWLNLRADTRRRR